MKEHRLFFICDLLFKKGKYPKKKPEVIHSENSHANFFACRSKNSNAIVKLNERSTRGISTIFFLPSRGIERAERGRSGQDRAEERKAKERETISSRVRSKRRK